MMDLRQIAANGRPEASVLWWPMGRTQGMASPLSTPWHERPTSGARLAARSPDVTLTLRRALTT